MQIYVFVSGTYHQGSIDIIRQYESSALEVCLFAICFSAIKNATLWESNDIEFIQDWGECCFVVDELFVICRSWESC